MKYLFDFKTIAFFFFLLLNTVFVFPQKKADTLLVNYVGESYVITAKSIRDKEIRKYSDSLNKWNYGQSLPIFLFDTLFDNNLAYLWDSYHQPISFRKLIFEKVKNVKILDVLANSSSLLLNYKEDTSGSVYIPYWSGIPYSNMSIKDLALDRLMKLKAKQ